MSLRDSLSAYWRKFQGELFPFLEETVGFLTVPHQVLVTVVDMTRLEAFGPRLQGLPGRPLAERAALARAFVAKAVLNLPTTRMLIERVEADKTLRRLCGWSRPCEVPSESTFSRAFAEFADSELPSRVHEALIRQTHVDRRVGHIARDSRRSKAMKSPSAPKSPAHPRRCRRPASADVRARARSPRPSRPAGSNARQA